MELTVFAKTDNSYSYFWTFKAPWLIETPQWHYYYSKWGLHHIFVAAREVVPAPFKRPLWLFSHWQQQHCLSHGKGKKRKKNTQRLLTASNRACNKQPASGMHINAVMHKKRNSQQCMTDWQSFQIISWDYLKRKCHNRPKWLKLVQFDYCVILKMLAALISRL